MGDSVITSNQNLVKEERQQKDEQDSASAVQSLVSVGNNNNNSNSSNNNNKKTGTTDFSVAALLPRNTKVCQSTGKHSAATMEISESSLACGSGELQPAEFQFNQCHLAGSSELMARHRENNHRSGSDQGDLGDAELGRGDGTSEDDTSLDNGFYLGEEAVVAASAAAATAAASGTSSASAGVAYVCPHCGLAAGSLSLLESHILTHGGAAAAAAASAEEDSRLSIDCSSSVGGGGGGVGGSGSSQPSSSRKYRCSQCSATFNWHGDLSQHLQASHGIDRGSKKPDSHGLYRCSHCSYQAKYQSELSRHNRLHLGVKPFACHFCAYNSAWKGDLKRHLEAHHRREIADDKTLSEIMANYKNNAGTRAARSTASQEELASRSLNDIDESSSSLLAGQNSPAVPQPLQQQQPETPIFPCSVCSFVCQSVADLRSHLATHNGSRPYRCSACGKRFHLSWESEKHIRREHCDSVRAYTAVAETGARAQVAPESALLPALCGLCGWRGGGDWEMARHLSGAHPAEAAAASILHLDEAEARNSLGWYQQGAVRLMLLHQHQRQQLQQQQQQPQVSSEQKQQPKNSSSQPSSGSLPAVKATSCSGKGVQGSRPFRCSVCGHRSNWKWDINKHIKVAHPERGDACTETMSSAEAEATIESYMRDVKGKVKDELAEAGDGYNRPFRCSACGHRSNWKWDVRKHIRQAHSNQPDAFVETLSNEDAKRTLDEYMTSRKCNASVANSGAVCGVAASAATATDATDADMDDASRSAVSSEMTQTPPLLATAASSSSAAAAASGFFGSPRVDQLRLKRFMCSGCGYRSNYRSDIVRHNKRKHDCGAAVRILSIDEARDSLEKYGHSFPAKPMASNGTELLDPPETIETFENNSGETPMEQEAEAEGEDPEDLTTTQQQQKQQQDAAPKSFFPPLPPSAAFHYQSELFRRQLQQQQQRHQQSLLQSEEPAASNSLMEHLARAAAYLPQQPPPPLPPPPPFLAAPGYFVGRLGLPGHPLHHHPTSVLHPQHPQPPPPPPPPPPNLLFMQDFAAHAAAAAAASATAAAAAANDSASTMSATSTTTTAATKSIVGASSKRAASESLKTELMKEKQLPASEEFHSCQRCPWLGLSHRDLIVHKQGHRTRAATVGKSASETAQQRCPAAASLPPARPPRELTRPFTSDAIGTDEFNAY
ncbi:hypothetical protein BOX15_Mlig031749g3 [Macrostomum lignano]|uniref:C2H2-type domain-containing protein n=1 Tax=Macrostomum lignano TaxID=282301 RepID=A0A267FWH6_9PLAT|nr:hypothetical protein BOX15_Mlig031749g3 [Macrostomum lignano]